MKNIIGWKFFVGLLLTLSVSFTSLAQTADPFEQGDLNMEDPALVQSDGYFGNVDEGVPGLNSAALNGCSPENAANDPNCHCNGDICTNHAVGGGAFDEALITPSGDNPNTTGDVDTET